MLMRLLLTFVSIVLLSACTTNQGLYHWGNYEQAAYAYAKNPGEVDEYVESLDKIIVAGEEKNRVPPGLYAEYAYALMIMGRTDDAMLSFGKERDKWPESRKLMDLMIDGPTERDQETVDRANINDTVTDKGEAVADTELAEEAEAGGTQESSIEEGGE